MLLILIFLTISKKYWCQQKLMIVKFCTLTISMTFQTI